MLKYIHQCFITHFHCKMKEICNHNQVSSEYSLIYEIICLFINYYLHCNYLKLEVHVLQILSIRIFNYQNIYLVKYCRGTELST